MPRYDQTRPRPAHELRAEMMHELEVLVYRGDLTAARALLDEVAMVFNDESVRRAKREAGRYDPS